MARIFIFRHGETYDNNAHIFSGWHNVSLDKQGIEEAREISEKLKDKNATIAYQSDQVRSQETLKIVLGDYHKGVEVITDPRIKERDYGSLTGLSKDELVKIDPINFERWHRGYADRPPGGESIQDVENRVLSFLEEVMSTWKKDDVIFISSSANTIRPMRRYFEKLSVDEMCSYEYTPAQIFEYQI